jgi:hypothetical protein
VSDQSGGLADGHSGPWGSLQDAAASETRRFRFPLIDRIWRVRGELPLDEPLAAEEAFARIDPMFQTYGTAYAVDGDTLTYTKRNPAAQDPLATFTRGRLQLASQGRSSVLHYDLSSTALMLCFLAPLLFLGFAQIAVGLNAWEKANVEVSKKAEKDEEKAKPVKQLNPVDVFLGAPAPEDPAKKKDKEKDKDKGRHSPTPAYVLAGLFFAIYLVGRVLEPWLIRRRLRNALSRT